VSQEAARALRAQFGNRFPQWATASDEEVLADFRRRSDALFAESSPEAAEIASKQPGMVAEGFDKAGVTQTPWADRSMFSLPGALSNTGTFAKAALDGLLLGAPSALYEGASGGDYYSPDELANNEVSKLAGSIGGSILGLGKLKAPAMLAKKGIQHIGGARAAIHGAGNWAAKKLGLEKALENAPRAMGAAKVAEFPVLGGFQNVMMQGDLEDQMRATNAGAPIESSPARMAGSFGSGMLFDAYPALRATHAMRGSAPVLNKVMSKFAGLGANELEDVSKFWKMGTAVGGPMAGGITDLATMKAAEGSESPLGDSFKDVTSFSPQGLMSMAFPAAMGTLGYRYGGGKGSWAPGGGTPAATTAPAATAAATTNPQTAALEQSLGAPQPKFAPYEVPEANLVGMDAYQARQARVAPALAKVEDASREKAIKRAWKAVKNQEPAEPELVGGKATWNGQEVDIVRPYAQVDRSDNPYARGRFVSVAQGGRFWQVPASELTDVVLDIPQKGGKLLPVKFGTLPDMDKLPDFPVEDLADGAGKNYGQIIGWNRPLGSADPRIKPTLHLLVGGPNGPEYRKLQGDLWDEEVPAELRGILAENADRYLRAHPSKAPEKMGPREVRARLRPGQIDTLASTAISNIEAAKNKLTSEGGRGTGISTANPIEAPSPAVQPQRASRGPRGGAEPPLAQYDEAAGMAEASPYWAEAMAQVQDTVRSTPESIAPVRAQVPKAEFDAAKAALGSNPEFRTLVTQLLKEANEPSLKPAMLMDFWRDFQKIQAEAPQVPKAPGKKAPRKPRSKKETGGPLP
jgi:hypothetical protein